MQCVFRTTDVDVTAGIGQLFLEKCTMRTSQPGGGCVDMINDYSFVSRTRGEATLIPDVPDNGRNEHHIRGCSANVLVSAHKYE